jgi:hypothetical protein
MHFKYHVFIIVCIVTAVLGVWQMFLKAPEVVIAQTDAESGDQFIRIVRASYGLNCTNLNYVDEPNSVTSNLGYQTAKRPLSSIREDNVLLETSNACNGKIACQLTPGVNFPSLDPLPACKNKLLDVEYRCFSFDKPWRMQVKQNSVMTIDCRQHK